MSTPLEINEMPDKTNVETNDPVFSNKNDAIGVPANTPTPIAIAESPNAFVNLSRPNNCTNKTGRRAVKNAEKTKRIEI